MSKKLENKVAIIFGASTGIGLATAKRFVEEGAYVFITGRRQSELDKAVAEIGKDVTAIQGDTGVLEDLDKIYKVVAEVKGKVDVIVPCAATAEFGTLGTTTPEQFDTVFNTNARGTFFSVAKGLPLLQDNGSVVLVSSAVHLKGFPGLATYAATKAAMRSFARTWAAELKDRNIRVNTLSPGAINTPMFTGQFPTAEALEAGTASYVQMTALGRIGEPEEIAAAALFLASNESSYATGIDLVVDGGTTQI